MKMTQIVNMAATVCELAKATAIAAHEECRPVSLLIGRDKSVTYLGGEPVAPSDKYPTRAQFLRRAEVEKMIGGDHIELAPACTVGDCEAALSLAH